MSKLRDYMSSPSTTPEEHHAYNEAVAALISFRNIHIQIVARYIVMPSRSPPASYIVKRKGVNLATASSKGQVTDDTGAPDRRPLHGTGGTNLMPFLKRTRDETRDTTLFSITDHYPFQEAP